MKYPFAATVFLLLLTAVHLPASSQPFTLLPTSIRPSILGSMRLADFDGDGDLDVFISGSEAANAARTARIYRNDGLSEENGAPVFTDAQAALPEVRTYISDVRAASVALGDYDNDNDVDVLVAGNTGIAIYKNNGNFLFSHVPVSKFQGSSQDVAFVEIINTASAALFDYDNDGDLDVLSTGRNKTVIYRNDGTDRFTEVKLGLPEINNGTVTWGDYDSDGDFDVLVMHRTFPGSPATYLFRNERGKVFADAQARFPGSLEGVIRWGDYDNDGDLDVLVVGRPGANRETTAPTGIYRNEDGVFVHVGNTLSTAYYGEWLDFDNDGDLDILLGVSESGSTSMKLLPNTNGAFDETVMELSALWYGAIATGDLDRDGDLDLLMTGQSLSEEPSSFKFLYYRNNTRVGKAPPDLRDIINQAPSPPTGLRARRVGDTLTLEWYPSTDDTTPSKGITYNLRVGTRSGASNVLSPLSQANGLRLVPLPGNAGRNLQWVISGVDPKRSYYWSVQSVDHSMTGSAFSRQHIIPGIGDEVLPPPILPSELDNYPNPFNPTTTIRYNLSQAGHVRISIYNLLGAQVAVLVNGSQPAGTHEVQWNSTDASGRSLPSGVYVYRMETEERVIARTMLLLK